MSEKQDVDKTVQTIDDFFVVYKAAKEAKEDDGKISLTESLGLLAHAGKLVRFVKNLPEIGDEIKDVDSVEAIEIAAALADGFDPRNPFIKPCMENAFKAIAGLKEAAELFIEAKGWEEDTQEG